MKCWMSVCNFHCVFNMHNILWLFIFHISVVDMMAPTLNCCCFEMLRLIHSQLHSFLLCNVGCTHLILFSIKIMLSLLCWMWVMLEDKYKINIVPADALALFALPGHKHPWYWLNKIKTLSFSRKYFSYLGHLDATIILQGVSQTGKMAII